MKIFVMGSCRVQSSLRTYKRLYYNSVDLVLFPPLLHTIEQHLVALGEKKYEEFKRYDDIFDLRWGSADFHQITKDNRFGNKLKTEDADIFVIEICGVKYYTNQKGYILHSFPRFYKTEKYSTKYSDRIEDKLDMLNYFIGEKPLVIVSNHNVYEKESRRRLILKLEAFDRYHDNVKLWNPTELIKEEGVKSCLKDVNHFTEKMKKLQAENILRLCKELI